VLAEKYHESRDLKTSNGGVKIEGLALIVVSSNDFAEGIILRSKTFFRVKT
jgi:hypothetical protein